MVKIIQTQVSQFIENSIDQELLSRRILGKIEDNGMLPPGFQADVDDWDTDRWGLEIPGTRRKIRMILNKWEPEE